MMRKKVRFEGRRGFVGPAIYTFRFADGGSYGKEEAQTTPLQVEEPAEQVLDLWRDHSHIARVGADSPFLSVIPLQLCCPPPGN